MLCKSINDSHCSLVCFGHNFTKRFWRLELNKKINFFQAIAIFIPVIVYATLMDYFHYEFLNWHPEILGYYYQEKCLILPSLILYFLSIKIIIFKSLFFKKFRIAVNIAILAILAFLIFFFSWLAFDSDYLTKNGIKSYSDFSVESFASAKIGITKSKTKTGANYQQYLQIYVIREKAPFTFNTFQNDYTIADFYNTYNGKIFFDGIKEMPVEIEIFGKENLNSYIEHNRLITPEAKARLKNLFENKAFNAQSNLQ